MKRKKRKTDNTKKAIFVLVALILIVGLFYYAFKSESIFSAARSEEFKVYFIDVGQGDATLIVSSGHAMLIDGGGIAESDKIYSFLKKRRISRLDYVIATHAHEDHIGGLSGALNYASVGKVYCPEETYDSQAFRNFNKYLKKQRKSISVPIPGETFKLGDATVMILGPLKETEITNNTCISLMVTYVDTKFVFTGDAQREAEIDLVEKYGDGLSADVLQIGHHGSDTATTYPFLRDVMPEFAVISCGKNNDYGHPHKGLLSKLRDAGAKVYRTDMQGTITCTSDGKTLAFTTEKNKNAVTNPTG